MPEDSFLWGYFNWAGMRLTFVAYGDLPAECIITELKQVVANDES